MGDEKLNILFTSCGRRVALLRYFRRTLDALGIAGEILAADACPSAPASFAADRQFCVPAALAPDYIGRLLELCAEHRVGLLFPLIDTELAVLAEHRARFAALGTRVVLSACPTLDLSFDKRSTYAFFREHGVDTPRVHAEHELAAIRQCDFPLMVKPWDGSSSIGATKVADAGELAYCLGHVRHAMVQEFLDGEEYTCDVLCGRDGQVQCVVPRKRLEVRAGEVSKGLTVKDPRIIAGTRAVAELLPGAEGCLTIQCFLQPDGRLRFTEINPRFGGGFMLSVHAGADMARWIIQEHLGLPCEAKLDAWQDDLAMLRFDDEIVVSGASIR